MNAVVTMNPAFQAPASSVFGALDAGDDLSGGITGGYGMLRIRGKVWAIHHRDQEVQLMRPDGDGPQGSVEIVILKANANLSKTWYENGWDESSANAPDCSSANGVTPDNGVPKKQANACAICPRNQWGTAPNGGKGKACSDHRRLAITPAADLANEAFGGPMLLRCPAASLQDLAAFDSKYKQAGYPYFSMVVKVSFDPKESYPKLIFGAVRPLNDQEAQQVLALRNGDSVARVIGDLVPGAAVQQIAPQQSAMFEQAPQGAPVAAVLAQPQAQPNPPAQPAPVQTVAATAPKPPVQAVQTGFGGVASAPSMTDPPAQPAPQQAPPAAPRPSQAMTGFGVAAPVAPAAAPAATVAPVQATQPQSQPLTPAPSVGAFEASLDDKLAALIGNG